MLICCANTSNSISFFSSIGKTTNLMKTSCSIFTLARVQQWNVEHVLLCFRAHLQLFIMWDFFFMKVESFFFSFYVFCFATLKFFNWYKHDGTSLMSFANIKINGNDKSIKIIRYIIFMFFPELSPIYSVWFPLN